MPREQQPLRPIKVDYRCDACGKGYYRPTRGLLLTAPPKFPHECTECGDKQTFLESYPTVRYAREGEGLNLDQYVQQPQ
jgi:DNA-directed RNA polymerase subunit RPC12/RpoP